MWNGPDRNQTGSFWDLTKAYDTIDQDRLFMILEGYGVGPRVRTILGNASAKNELVPRKGGLYGGSIPRQRGVPQGDPLSPSLFNLAIDAVAQATTNYFGGDPNDDTKLSFYADDGKIGGRNPVQVQRYLDYMTDLSNDWAYR